MINLTKIQRLVSLQMAEKWNLTGDKVSVEMMLLGVVEEVGEAAHALLKHKQGLRGMDNESVFKLKFSDAIGDIAIYLTQVCEAMGLDIEQVIEATYQEVMRRNDYNLESLNGTEKS